VGQLHRDAVARPVFHNVGPMSLAGVVAVVREAEAAHITGPSFWQQVVTVGLPLTTHYVIDTTHLSRPLQTVQRALRKGEKTPLLYHVEAGITIRNLYGTWIDWASRC